MSHRPENPVFVGNFEYDATAREVEGLFDKYGPVERIDMKQGFAFVFMKDKRDGDDAISRLNGKEFGHRRRRLKVEWAKGDGDIKRREDKRRRAVKPNTTLFVVNFDSEHTRERDLERHFEPFGKLRRVHIKHNYAFVQFESQQEATDALQSLHLSNLLGRAITVEYVAREPGDWGTEVRKPAGRGRDVSRSRSPAPKRGRRRSPSYDRGRRRPSYDSTGSLTPPRRSRRASPSLSPSPPSDRAPSDRARADANGRDRRRSRSRTASRSRSRSRA